MKVVGKVHKVLDLIKVSDKFKKRDLVIETGEKYPQLIAIETHNDNTDMLNNLREGDIVECDINLRGREWKNPQGETKYFNSLVCWRMSLLDDERSNEAAFSPKEYAKKEADKMFHEDIARSYEPEDEDLPF